MKLEIEFDNSETFTDTLFISLLKQQLSEARTLLRQAWHQDDIKAQKDIIKSCKILLKYYGQ